jgi:hypothetical protein
MAWHDELHLIKNKRGVTFADFCTECGQEKRDLLAFTFKPQSSDPSLKDRDNAQTVAYIARAGYMHSKARAFALQAKGVAVWSLIREGTKLSVVSDVAKRYLADFEEEAMDWETISDSLHERLWTGRGEMRRLNRGEG